MALNAGWFAGGFSPYGRTSGLQEIEDRLNAALAKIKNGALNGLVEAGMLIRAEAMKKCPVATGNLRASAFVVWNGGSEVEGKFNEPPGRKGIVEKRTAELTQALMESRQRVASKDRIIVEIGFSAVYATVTHENPRAGKTGGVSPSGRLYPPGTWAAKGEWKFLENAMKENETLIISTVAKAAKV